MSLFSRPRSKAASDSMHGRRLHEDFRRSGPDHHDAVDGLLEGANVGDNLLGQIALVLAFLHMRAVQPLHVIAVENCRHRLDGFKIRLELFEDLGLQNFSVRGSLVHVVFKDVPTGKDDIVQDRRAEQNP